MPFIKELFTLYHHIKLSYSNFYMVTLYTKGYLLSLYINPHLNFSSKEVLEKNWLNSRKSVTYSKFYTVTLYTKGFLLSLYINPHLNFPRKKSRRRIA